MTYMATQTREIANFSDYQRLDTIDQAAIQSLAYEYAEAAFGSVVGGGFEGAMSPLRSTAWAAGAEYFMSLGKFAFFSNVSFGTQDAEEVHSVAEVVQFDPADVGHSNYPIDFTAARASADAASWNEFPYIWARAIRYDTSVDNRRFWDTGAAAEINDPAYATRNVTRVEFSVNLLEPVGTGWCKVAQVSNWLAGNDVTGPLIETEFWFDSDEYYSYLGLANEANIRYSDTTGLELDDLQGINGLPRSLGILHHLLLARRQIHRALCDGQQDDAATSNIDWDQQPLLSLNGAKVELDALAATINNIQALQQDQFTAGSAMVLYTPNQGSPNDGAVQVTHGRNIVMGLAGGNPLVLTLTLSRPAGISSNDWANVYLNAVLIGDILTTPQGTVGAKQPLRILPVIAPGDQQMSDLYNVDNDVEFQIHVYQDQDQDGVFSIVEDGASGFNWATFEPFSFAVSIVCSFNSKS